MSVPKQEADDALHAIASITRRSVAAYEYRIASPHLLLWGVIWMVGYAEEFFGGYSPWLWGVLVVAGIVASFALNPHIPGVGRAQYGRRFGATVAALVLFIAGLEAIMAPHVKIQYDALFPLLVALAYALKGIWGNGARMLWLGAALGAVTFIGYFGLPHYFPLWIAGMGGGALVLGGFWLRMV